MTPRPITRWPTWFFVACVSYVAGCAIGIATPDGSAGDDALRDVPLGAVIDSAGGGTLDARADIVPPGRDAMTTDSATDALDDAVASATDSAAEASATTLDAVTDVGTDVGCSALPDQACTPGGTQACGNCGTQTCQSDCTWGACAGSMACSPGATHTESCGNCGSRTYTCSASCVDVAGDCAGEGACSPGATQAGGCDPCSEQVCTNSCTWGGCTLRPGNACEWQSGRHSRSCSACTCGLQFCLPACQWSTACVSCCSTCGGCL